MLRRLVSITLAFTIWQLVAFYLDSVLLPSPWACVRAFLVSIQDGTLWKNTTASLVRVAVGYSFAAFGGILLGALSGITATAGLAVRDVLEFLRPIPPIAWVPIAILWFGLGDASAWFIVFLGAFFPIFIQVSHAFANCPSDYLEITRSYKASPWISFWWVRVPAAAPAIAQGLRVGLGLAWTSVIAAELVGVNNGLGDRIQQLRYVSDYEGMLVCMFAIGLLGWLMVFGANYMERRLVSWQKSSM